MGGVPNRWHSWPVGMKCSHSWPTLLKLATWRVEQRFQGTSPGAHGGSSFSCVRVPVTIRLAACQMLPASLVTRRPRAAPTRIAIRASAPCEGNFR
jgi:hypothetical protein